jgi:hypothetical protein
MFIWTNGMHPGFALVFFVVGLVFVLYSLASAFRWTCGWDREEERGDRRAPRRARLADPRVATGWECGHRMCRSQNPPHARYCRMCGRQKTS